MGELVTFRVQPREPRSGTPRSGGAEILFFTGVRYMRTDDYAENTKARNHRPESRRQPARDQVPH